MSEGIPGVKVQLDGVNSADSAAFIAGYTGFETTQALWEHLEGKDVKKILEKYYALRQEKAASKALDSLSPKITHFVFRNPLYAEAIASPSLPQKDDIVGDDTISYVTMVWVACRLLEEGPEILLDSKVSKGRDLPKDITPEDFNRALHVLRFAWKQRQKAKKTGAKGGRQKRPAAKVKYAPSKTDAAGKTQSGLHLDEEMLAMMAEDAATATERTSLDADVDDEIDVSVITSAKSSQGRTRPPLAPELRTKLLDLIADRAIVLSDEWVDPTHKQLEIFQSIAAEVEADLTHERPRDKEITRTESAMLRGVSAQEPTYKDACEFLQLDPTEPVLFPDSRNPLTLKAWQVNGIAFIIQREMSPLRGGGISDCCGLGKTVQTLAATYLKPELGFDEGPFKPTLVLSPASVVYVWALEAMRFFKGKLRTYIYHRSKEQMSDPTLKDMIVNDADLAKFLADLDPDDPNTSKTIVVSSYTTWQNRTTIKVPDGKGESTLLFDCSQKLGRTKILLVSLAAWHLVLTVVKN